VDWALLWHLGWGSAGCLRACSKVGGWG
jgi:hypothetical protein